jgi:ABC-type phosphate transport system substrate-binding protein
MHPGHLPHLIAAIVFMLLGTTSPAVPEPLRLGGKSGTTELMHQLGTRFTQATRTAIDVVPALGTTAAISATIAGSIHLALTGRALTAAEAANDLTPLFNLCTPFVLATSHPAPGSLNSAEIAAVFSRSAPSWPDGMPIRLILRQKHESDNDTMLALFPNMQQALDQARKRQAAPMSVAHDMSGLGSTRSVR